ncbi:MAG: hypothetical protein KC656_09220, partial [Myxococcales bacterium]|nr:hypothetical protein [Myxococcales bacterium]
MHPDPWECAYFEMAIQGELRTHLQRLPHESDEAHRERALHLAEAGLHPGQRYFYADQEYCREKWPGRYPALPVIPPPAEDTGTEP